MFNLGQVLYFLGEGHTTAPRGALAVVIRASSIGRQPRDEYVCIQWLSYSAGNQIDGHYSPGSFRPATREEVQDLYNKTETWFNRTRDALQNMPTYKVGDFVFSATHKGHVDFPYLVVAIEEGMAMTYRPRELNDCYAPFPVADLTPRPTALADYWRRNPEMKEKYPCLEQT